LQIAKSAQPWSTFFKLFGHKTRINLVLNKQAVAEIGFGGASRNNIRYPSEITNGANPSI
jgi:hypothetical protein